MKDKTYKRSQTCVYNINYHIVWTVKYRRKVLSPELAEELKTLLTEIGNEKGFAVVQCEVGENDHVHLFVSAPTTISPQQIVKYLKGISGRLILMHHPEIKDKLWKGHLWNDSYFIETIGSVGEDAVKAYIDRQLTCMK